MANLGVPSSPHSWRPVPPLPTPQKTYHSILCRVRTGQCLLSQWENRWKSELICFGCICYTVFSLGEDKPEHNPKQMKANRHFLCLREQARGSEAQPSCTASELPGSLMMIRLEGSSPEPWERGPLGGVGAPWSTSWEILNSTIGVEVGSSQRRRNSQLHLRLGNVVYGRDFFK